MGKSQIDSDCVISQFRSIQFYFIAVLEPTIIKFTLFRYFLEVIKNLEKMVYSYPRIRQLAGKIMAVHNVHIILATVYVACSQIYQRFIIIIPDAQESIVDVEESKDKQLGDHPIST